MSGIGDKRARNERMRVFIQGFLSLQGSVPAAFLPCPVQGSVGIILRVSFKETVLGVERLPRIGV